MLRVAALILVVLFAHAPVYAVTAFVQSVTARDTGSATTVAATPGTAITAGNLLAVYVHWTSSTSSLVSVTDNKSNTYTLVRCPTISGTTQACGAYASNVVAGSTTVTATFNNSGNLDKRIIVHEVSGVSTGSVTGGPLDCSASNTQINPGNPTDVITSGTCVPSISGGYVFGATGNVSSNGQVPGTGYTQRIDQTTRESEDRIQSSAAAIAATFTPAGAGNNDNWITFVMVFNPPFTSVSAPSGQRKQTRKFGR